MESVSCHQKGLVMGNILWSVDKKIYSDKEDHTLAITGWAITRNQSECDFILYGSGKELSVPEPSRCERADVAKDLKETKDIKEVGNVGFTVKIPEIIKLAEEHEKLQLALRAGDEKEIKGSLRFNYMIPVPEECIERLVIKDVEDEKYRLLLNKEYQFCMDNAERIQKKANKIYEMVITNRKQKLTDNSCSFSILEQGYQEYVENVLR